MLQILREEFYGSAGALRSEQKQKPFLGIPMCHTSDKHEIRDGSKPEPRPIKNTTTAM